MRSLCGRLVLCVVICFPASVSGMVFDNRYLDLTYPRSNGFTFERRSNVMSDALFMTGKRGYPRGDDTVGLPEILGTYDQNQLREAMVAAGYPEPYPTDISDLIGKPMNWFMDGSLQLAGLSLIYNQNIGRYVSIGGSLFFASLISRMEFRLQPEAINTYGLTEAQVAELDKTRLQMNTTLSIDPTFYNAIGFSDIDVYIRLCNSWKFKAKCRAIDAGASIGLLVPSGLPSRINNAASIPFGGNRHWGIYGAADFDAEVKEDLHVGALLRINQRWDRAYTARFPQANEQVLFGALTGQVDVEPGLTVIFTPSVRFEGLRDRFGAELRYNLIHHHEDTWRDIRPIKDPVSTIERMTAVSEWYAEYATIHLYFDGQRAEFSTDRQLPFFSIAWDIPLRFIMAQRVAETFRIMIGVRYNF